MTGSSSSLTVATFDVTEDADRLVENVLAIGPCIVAYSGGVDSAVVAAAAHRADLHRADSHRADQHPVDQHRSIAVTADSPSVSREQLETALRVAKELGLWHRVIETDELDREDYRVNDRQRCFYCKQTLYRALAAFAKSQGITSILSGTNADDLGDYRPGIQAGRDAGVIAPLALLGLTKARVRAIARHWGISVSDRPAQPCLSSRLAYGVGVTRERLRKIELAEAFLRERGYSTLRVRMLADEEASIEVSLGDIVRLTEAMELTAITDYCHSIGFTRVRVDPRGFRSGSMNELVQLTATTPDSRST